MSDKISKKDVLEHRSRTHQIFLTIFGLILGLSINKLTLELIDLLLVLSICYYLTIFQNLFCELKFVSSVKLFSICRRKITLIIPIAFFISFLRFQYTPMSSLKYMFTILIIYISSIVIMYGLQLERVKESKNEA